MLGSIRTPADFERWASEHSEKLTVDDVLAYPQLAEVAVDFLARYKGQFDFLIDMQRRVAEGEPLTPAQVRGVLNSYLADIRRRRPASTAATTAPVIGRRHGPVDLTREADPEARVVPNGIYTVVFDGNGEDYVTLRLVDNFVPDAPKGSQVAQWLIGPDNDQDYRGFAFVRGTRVFMWRRYANNERLRRALELLLSTEDFGAYGLEYAKRSGNCWRCGRTLTVPLSISRGIGPICLGKLLEEEL